MTTPKSYEVIHQEMVQNFIMYHALLFSVTIYGLLLSDSGQLSKAKEKIQAFFEDPDYVEKYRDYFSEVDLREEELQKVLIKLVPELMYAVHEELEVGEEIESTLSPIERGISRLLLDTDFAR